MARYPDDPRPISPYPFRNNRPTVSGGPEWAPQSRGLTRFGLHEADLTYRGKSWAQIMTLYNFFESVGGAAGRFTFVDFNGIGLPGSTDHPGVAWTRLFIAKGDGATTSWDLPTFGLKADPAPVVYEDGVAMPTVYYSGGDVMIAPGAYLVIPGTGTDGVDSLLAGTHPAKPTLVTISGTCRRACRRAKFLSPKNPFVLNVPANYYQETVTILEVRK